MYDFHTQAGIDALYFFYATNAEYENLFLDLIDQISRQVNFFNASKLQYNNEDIKVKIGSGTYEYLGKSKGFHWFRDLDGFFRFGCKDANTNRALHNIQMQYQATGIYTIGIKGLLRFTDDLFHGAITGQKLITRADLNIFLQSDLSFIQKEDFVTRKRLYITHFKEVASKYKRQTLYIGRKPFMMRLYDKREELKQSKKESLMKEYLATHGIDIKAPLDNLEFEYHRKALKDFGIETVDQLLENAEALFHDAMDAIRMVDLTNFTDNTEDQKNKHRAPTHPLWEYIKSQYTIKEFLQTDMPLERIKRKMQEYSYEDAIDDHVMLARKCAVHSIPMGMPFYQDVIDTIAYPKKKHNDFAVMKHAFDATPRYPDVTTLSNFDLRSLHRQLEHDMNDPSKNLEMLMRQMGKVLQEMERRGFPKSFPF